MAHLHLLDVLVAARRRTGRSLQIQRHQHRLDAGLLELRDHLVILLPGPLAIPVLGERLDVRPLAFNPGFSVGVAMQVDDTHANYPVRARLHARAFDLSSRPESFLTPCRRLTAESHPSVLAAREA